MRGTASQALRAGPELSITPLSGALGAEIRGVDLANSLSDGLFAQIRRAFNENIVLVFPEQKLAPEEQAAFMRRFGSVEEHPLGSRRGVEDHPQVMVLENRPGMLGPRNDFWHSDITFAEVPPLGSALYALTVTPGRADTMFCNMYAAYENLSPGLRRMLDGMTAIHTAEELIREVPSRVKVKEAPPGVEHPVVRTHPETKRKALYINPYFTSHFKDMTREESWILIQHLTAKATVHENIYRHHWKVGDVVLWDNRCAMHYGVRDYDETMPRLMHRTTAGGDRPV